MKTLRNLKRRIGRRGALVQGFALGLSSPLAMFGSQARAAVQVRPSLDTAWTNVGIYISRTLVREKVHDSRAE